MIELTAETEEIAGEELQKQEKLDNKSRDFYLKDVPLTAEKMAESEKKMEEAIIGPENCICINLMIRIKL